MRDNLLAVYALKISVRFRLFCVQIDHQLHELNYHIFYHKIQHVMFCEFTYTKRLVNYLTKGNLIPELYFAANLISIRQDNVQGSNVKSTTHY